MAEVLPANISIAWHRGNKSFCEVIKNHKKQMAYVEAPPGKQLPDAAFREIFFVMMALARANPNDLFHYTRYDQEDVVPVNDNNRDFTEGRMEKTIYIEGHIYRSKL